MRANAEMQDVSGRCKVASRACIEAADWSLTPGRHVGIAPAVAAEYFDFEQTLRDIQLNWLTLTARRWNWRRRFRRASRGWRYEQTR